MAQLNKASLLTQLKTAAENATDTTVLAALTASLEKLSDDRIVALATVGDLPDADTLPSGSVFFVDSIGVMVMAVGNKWLGLDGRLLRDDTPPVDAVAWGKSNYGQLGDGTTVNKSSPVTVAGGITNWSQVSAGANHGLGIAGGVAYAWGSNNESGFFIAGQLGDGTAGYSGSTDKSSPVTVVGGITNWSQVSAGETHSLGIAGGIAYAWGKAQGGGIGIGVPATKSSPVTVVGGITNWSQVSAGNSNSLGLTDAGIAYAWGTDYGGGDTVIKSSPVTVVGGITNWSQVSAGGGKSLGIAGGVAYAWGVGSFGRLGDGTVINKSSPVTVVGGITNWSQVSAGLGLHSVGITTDGIAYAWGRGANGQLGDGTTTTKSSPVTVVGGITNWSQVSAGSVQSIGLTDAGIAYAWGYAYNGTAGGKSSPTIVVGGISNWSQVSAGGGFILGLKN